MKAVELFEQQVAQAALQVSDQTISSQQYDKLSAMLDTVKRQLAHQIRTDNDHNVTENVARRNRFV